MVSRDLIFKDAGAIAEEAMDLLDEPTWGVRFEMVTEHIEQILDQWRFRAPTHRGYSRWRQCVADAAIDLADSGEYPTGARLEMLSERLFNG